jgi:hypothetical protein
MGKDKSVLKLIKHARLAKYMKTYVLAVDSASRDVLLKPLILSTCQRI